MGIFIDYAFCTECSEEELLLRLNRLRRKILELPVELGIESASEVIRVDPVYSPMVPRELQKQGYVLPELVARRLAEPQSESYNQLRIGLVSPFFSFVPDELVHRFEQPGYELAKNSPYWREEDFPEELEIGGSLTYYRGGIFLEFARVLLRYGYVIVVNPGKGCESVCVGLSAYRTSDPNATPLWLGSGFTKTQYAQNVKNAHTTVCHILDLAKEAGLLYAAHDNSGYYEHRDWQKSAEVIREELGFVRAFSQIFEEVVQDDPDITTISSPALGPLDPELL
ncbi:hypothetical protein [Armatimonas sp.]|uniref:hypothetical protein n=1 Tax=Armatimonas sp. TaxID=1872638 RepID=UPI003752F4EA